MINKNKQLLERALKTIPGGVNSPVRAFKSVGLAPIFISKAKGSKIYSVNDNEYIDYVGSWGPMILGHANDHIINAVNKTILNGTSFGAPCTLELEIAELINSIIPSIELIRMVNSGTEAAMSAVRLARGYTNKDKIIKFEGCYHGHGDSFLIKSGSGALTLGTPSSQGITKSVAKDTLIAQFNDIKSVESLIKKYKNQVAAVIIEPIMGNAGCIPPINNFLDKLSSLCSNEGILLILDEVMTGFRVSLQGAQGLYNITPDITCLGKIIGGGFPVGAYGGKKEIMKHVSPLGNVYQAGTLSGNPVAMAAGLETLKLLNKPNVYKQLEERSAQLEQGVNKNIKNLGLKLTSNRVGSMFSLFFTNEKIIDLKSANTSNTKKFAHYFNEMINMGIYIAPSQFETGFISLAHSEDDIEKTIKANYIALKSIYS